jgi:antitoxin component of MazEF toxin-antitoxin module
VTHLDEEKQQQKVRTRIKRINKSLVVVIPSVIVEVLDLCEGDIVKIPFMDIEKVENRDNEEDLKEYSPDGLKETIVKIKNRDRLIVKQMDVIKVLNKATIDMESYRTTYVLWNGRRYGIKKVCEKVFGFIDFNTLVGERCLRELGFKVKKEEY